jgi:hypothetical protein
VNGHICDHKILTLTLTHFIHSILFHTKLVWKNIGFKLKLTGFSKGHFLELCSTSRPNVLILVWFCLKQTWLLIKFKKHWPCWKCIKHLHNAHFIHASQWFLNHLSNQADTAYSRQHLGLVKDSRTTVLSITSVGLFINKRAVSPFLLKESRTPDFQLW